LRLVDRIYRINRILVSILVILSVFLMIGIV
jgi:hypothetical protein